MQEEIKTDVVKSEHWQWIKGDDSGDVVTFKEEGPVWIEFNEGGRIATELRDEFLQPLDKDIAGEFINGTNSGIDPLGVSATPSVTILKQPKLIIKDKSPVRVLFDKQKKKTEVNLMLKFPVNIPTKAIYELMSTSFDSTEVNEQLYSFILDQLSEDEITNCLQDSIKSLIENKYKGE